MQLASQNITDPGAMSFDNLKRQILYTKDDFVLGYKQRIGTNSLLIFDTEMENDEIPDQAKKTFCLMSHIFGKKRLKRGLEDIA